MILKESRKEPGSSVNPLVGGWRGWVVGERQAVATVFANGAGALSVLLSGIVMARALGPEGRGLIAAHLAGIVTSVAVGSLGVNYAAAYAAARSGLSRDTFRAVWAFGLGSLFVTALLDLGVEALLVRSSSASETAWAVLGAVVSQASGVAIGWIQGSRQMTAWNVLRAIPYSIQLSFLLILWWAEALTVVRSLCAFTIAHGITAVVAASIARTAPVAFDAPSLSPFRYLEIWQFARGIAMSTILYQLNQRLDQLALALMGRTEDLGIYASAVTLASLGFPVGAGLAQATYAEGLHASASGRARLERRRIHLALLSTSACAIALAIAGRPLMILLYGTPFARGASALTVLSWGTVFLAGNYVAAESLRSGGKSGATIRADSAALCVSLVCLPFAIAWMGILGAAVVSLLSYALGFTLNRRASLRWHAQEVLAANA